MKPGIQSIIRVRERPCEEVGRGANLAASVRAMIVLPTCTSAVYGFSMIRVSMLLCMFVGTQVAYLLAPFMGKEPPYTLLGERPSSSYVHVVQAMLGLFRTAEGPQCSVS